MSTYTTERLSDAKLVVAPHPEAVAPTTETSPPEPKVLVLIHDFTEPPQLGIEQWLTTTFQGVVEPKRVGMKQLVESCKNGGARQYDGALIVVPKELWGDYAAGLVTAFRARLPQAEYWFL